MWPWRVKMPTQDLLRLLLLLMLMLKYVLTTVWCRFGGWSLVVKLNLCSDFEHRVRSIFWSWSLVSILLVMLFEVIKFTLGWDSEDEIWSRFVWEAAIWPKVTLVSRTQPSGPLCLWQCFILGHQLPCGLNGALYFVEMDKDGGLGAYPGNQWLSDTKGAYLGN